MTSKALGLDSSAPIYLITADLVRTGSILFTISSWPVDMAAAPGELKLRYWPVVQSSKCWTTTNLVAYKSSGNPSYLTQLGVQIFNFVGFTIGSNNGASTARIINVGFYIRSLSFSFEISRNGKTIVAGLMSQNTKYSQVMNGAKEKCTYHQHA